jgi:hypothetical protein
MAPVDHALPNVGSIEGSGLRSVDDDERAMTSCCDGMWNTSWNQVDLASMDLNDGCIKLKFHLAIEDEQCLGKAMGLVRVAATVHAQHLQVDTGSLTNDRGFPSDRKSTSKGQKICFAHEASDD